MTKTTDPRFTQEQIADLREMLRTASVFVDNNAPWQLSVVVRKIKEVCDEVRQEAQP